jgi:hypothetical protein
MRRSIQNLALAIIFAALVASIAIGIGLIAGIGIGIGTGACSGR